MSHFQRLIILFVLLSHRRHCPFPLEVTRLSGEHTVWEQEPGPLSSVTPVPLWQPRWVLHTVWFIHSQSYSANLCLRSVYKPYPKCRTKALTVPLRFYICGVMSQTLWSKVSSESDDICFLLQLIYLFQPNKKHLKPRFCILLKNVYFLFFCFKVLSVHTSFFQKLFLSTILSIPNQLHFNIFKIGCTFTSHVDLSCNFHFKIILNEFWFRSF